MKRSSETVEWLVDRLEVRVRRLRFLGLLSAVSVVLSIATMIYAFVAGGSDNLLRGPAALSVGLTFFTTLGCVFAFDLTRRVGDVYSDELSDVVQRRVASRLQHDLDDEFEFDDSIEGTRRRLVAREYSRVRRLPLITSDNDSAIYAALDLVILVTALFGLYQ